MIDIELVFSAVGLPDELVERWIELNKSVLGLVHACVVTDSHNKWTGLRTVHVKPQERFDIGKINNRGIRSSNATVIAKTDIDIVFSLQLIEHIWGHVVAGTGVIGTCANVDLPTGADLGNLDWATMPKRVQGRGACFAMHRRDWDQLRGYDERFLGFGADDDDLSRRAHQMIYVVQTMAHKLLHINHPRRIDARFPNCGRKNLQIVEERGPWHEQPESENWGLDLGDLGDILAGECDFEKI